MKKRFVKTQFGFSEERPDQKLEEGEDFYIDLDEDKEESPIYAKKHLTPLKKDQLYSIIDSLELEQIEGKKAELIDYILENQ